MSTFVNKGDTILILYKEISNKYYGKSFCINDLNLEFKYEATEQTPIGFTRMVLTEKINHIFDC